MGQENNVSFENQTISRNSASTPLTRDHSFSHNSRCKLLFVLYPVRIETPSALKALDSADAQALVGFENKTASISLEFYWVEHAKLKLVISSFCTLTWLKYHKISYTWRRLKNTHISIWLRHMFSFNVLDYNRNNIIMHYSLLFVPH